VSGLAVKVESALERAFHANAHESLAADATLIAGLVIKHYGDGEAARVLTLAAKLCRETVADLDKVKA